MAKIIDFPTATPQEMMAINEVVFANVINDGELSSLVDIREGVKSGDRLAWVNPLSLIGKPSRGCEPVSDTATADLVEKTWDLQEFDVRIEQCYADLEEILYSLGLKDGIERGDLTGTEYAMFLETLVTNALDKMYKRLVFFGDKTAEHITDGGHITDTVDVDYFTIIDGVFKQIATMIAGAEAVVVTTIAANAEATKAAQMAYNWDPIAILQAAILNANVAIEGEDDPVIYVTRFFMAKLKAKMLSLPQYTESQFSKNELGFNTVTFLGHTITEMKEWDEQIIANHSGTAYYKPFRALYTTKKNLKVGVPSLSTFKVLKAWYENKDRKYYIDAMDKLDCIVMRPELVSIAW